mgnify:CR=1 FL=1
MSRSPLADLTGSANSALLVVTTAVDDVRAGCLVGYHSQASMSPQHYCFWLSKANHTYRVGLLASHFAVHFLTAHDHDLAERFAGSSGQNTDKFADIAVETGEHGVPLVTALPNRMIVERVAILDDGGDHVCVTARVLRAESDGHFTPLRTLDILDIKPAHGPEERILEP